MKTIKISSIQLVALVFSTLVGTGILNLPAALAKSVYQDAWIAVLLGGVVTLLLTNLGLLLVQQYPEKNLLEISTTLLGNIPGRILNFLFFLELYFMASAILRNFVDFISTWILQKTPIEVLMMVIMVTSLYMAYKGFNTIVLFSEITTLLILPFSLVLFLPYKDWNFLNLLPIGVQPGSAYITATLSSAFSFVGFEVIFFVFPKIQGSLKKKFLTSNLAILIVALAYFTTVFTSVLVFGSNGLQNEVYAALKYTSYIQVALLERFEFAMMYFWIFAMFSTFALYFYFSLIALRHTFPIQETNRWIPLVLMIALRPLALRPQNIAEVGLYAEQRGIYALIVIAGAFILLNLVSFVKIKLFKK